MKSIDELHFSDESFDLSVERKGSFDFANDETSSRISLKLDEPNSLFKEKNDKLTIDPGIVARYARTICDLENVIH